MELDSVDPTDGAICLAHITDPHLARRVTDFAEEGDCAVCETQGSNGNGPVVNLEHVARVVDVVASRAFDHEGLFIDHEQLMEPLGTGEVVASLIDGSVEPDFAELIIELVTDLIHHDQDWFEPFDIDGKAGIEFEWNDFEQSIKHESRLLSPPTGSSPETAPEKNYAFVRSLLVFADERAGLIRTLPQGTRIYRARIDRDARTLVERVRNSPARELGPAPVERVTAGRMNAQGVPMLYVARDEETACAEVASHSPYDEAVVGEFVLQQPLRILDLTQVPPPRSVFDDSYEEGDDRLSSLSFYADRITRAVILDDNHPVDYVLSQVLTEAFRWWTSPRIDGIAFSSRVRDGGVNMVLFFGDARWYEQQNEPASRFTHLERETERGIPEPVFVIDPKTVRRYRVTRALAVERTPGWAS